MSIPRLALRFRELTPGVDTVASHNLIIKKQGYTWWGWWKKQTEPDRTKDLRILKECIISAHRLEALLIDTSAERMHRAIIVDIHTGKLSEPEKLRVPKYYRDVADVAAWFKVTSIIADVPYEIPVENSIDPNTMITFLDHA
jgi:hypothetical protein